MLTLIYGTDNDRKNLHTISLVLLILLGCAVIGQTAMSQEPTGITSAGTDASTPSSPPVAPLGDDPDTEENPLLSLEQLEVVVGPIALFPDDLIGIILPATTYPLQIVQAARYLKQHEQDLDLPVDADWDDSIVALLNYPEVIDMLDEDLDWTWELGAAVLNQQGDVMDAIQQFRQRALAAGNLDTDDKQIVNQEEEIIEIQPASPEVIYVPRYEPEQVIVYQPEPVYRYYSTAYPVYYYPYGPDYRFGTRFFWGLHTAFHIGWNTHYVNVFPYHYQQHPYYGSTFYFDFYRNNYRKYRRRNQGGISINVNLNGNRNVADYRWRRDRNNSLRPRPLPRDARDQRRRNQSNTNVYTNEEGNSNRDSRRVLNSNTTDRSGNVAASDRRNQGAVNRAKSDRNLQINRSGNNTAIENRTNNTVSNQSGATGGQNPVATDTTRNRRNDSDASRRNRQAGNTDRARIDQNRQVNPSRDNPAVVVRTNRPTAGSGRDPVTTDTSRNRGNDSAAVLRDLQAGNTSRTRTNRYGARSRSQIPNKDVQVRRVPDRTVTAAARNLQRSNTTSRSVSGQTVTIQARQQGAQSANRQPGSNNRTRAATVANPPSGASSSIPARRTALTQPRSRSGSVSVNQVRNNSNQVRNNSNQVRNNSNRAANTRAPARISQAPVNQSNNRAPSVQNSNRRQVPGNQQQTYRNNKTKLR